jgi:hypothetical protein
MGLPICREASVSIAGALSKLTGEDIYKNEKKSIALATSATCNTPEGFLVRV